MPLRINPIKNSGRSQIRGENNNGVFKIDCPALRISDCLLYTSLDDGWTQLTEKEREFQDGKEEGWQEILNARQELSDGKQGLADGEKEYEEGKAESDQEIADAKKELEQARKDLNELEVPEWYVLDRTDYPGHSDFGDDSDRIAAIARVFPVFFLLVAALVCLTTMTRMVEEPVSYTHLDVYKRQG